MVIKQVITLKKLEILELSLGTLPRNTIECLKKKLHVIKMTAQTKKIDDHWLQKNKKHFISTKNKQVDDCIWSE